MSFAEVDAVTLDCFGTLVALGRPAALQAGARCAAARAETVRPAFATEGGYYRAHLGEGRDTTRSGSSVSVARRSS